jgi:hypothetical protein
MTSNHPSNTAPVFVRFVSRWRREEFYSCYLLYVNKKLLLIATVFRQYKENLSRIYVSEHLRVSDGFFLMADVGVRSPLTSPVHPFLTDFLRFIN